jgi:hypothetical protein
VPPLLYQLGGVVLVGISVVLLGKAGLLLRRYLRLRRADAVDVRELSRRDCPVVVSGLARQADDVLIAPQSGDECFAYEYRIEKASRRAQTASGAWEHEHDRSGDVPFLLADDTGSVLVVPAGAELRLDEHLVTSTHEADGRRFGRAGDKKLHEARLDAGEQVTIYGTPISGTGTGWGDVDVVLGDGDGGGEAIVADGSRDSLRADLLQQAAKCTVTAVPTLAVGLHLVGATWPDAAASLAATATFIATATPVWM